MLALINLFFFINIFFLTCNQHGCLAQRRHIFIYSGCSQERYQPNTPYETNLNSLLSSIVASSSQTLYNLFAFGNSTGEPPDSAVYGLYQCRGDLKPKDCSTCISSLISQIALLCPYTSGASLQLDGCFVRYEETDFLGRLDDSLRYKKCSAGGGGDRDFLRRRDGVLAGLQGEATSAGFGVSAAGAVEGYAQCLGDLAAADCAACLGEAVVEVKSLCGTAAAGDVFLAQCYVRYWESGYYDDSSSSDSTNQDNVGRTVAIIVGVVVGVAVLIILLSFCKNTLCK
ncbi:hypothetical protein CASFOL_005855 [Castilleja foliolosa]|uniref:Gnk2-homologous domain-containing protein n=1 Tax=Castilleja foliolosa TaxID=1961234 RepID=A0ABD3E580_9LAMI